MQSLNIYGVNDVRLAPKRKPVAGSRDAVIAIKSCGICGSDLRYVQIGGMGHPEGGFTPIGHEAAGEVIAVGEGITDIRVGQRVVINPMNTSSNIGSGGPEGAFSDEVLVMDVQAGETLLPIPDDVPYELAALTEPLAVALHGVNRSGVKPGQKAVVFGCGPIGLAMVLWLVDRDVDVVAIDLTPERLERALAMGARSIINASTENVRDRIRVLHGSHRYFGMDVANTDVYLDAAGAPSIVGDVTAIAKLHAVLSVTAASDFPTPVNFMHAHVRELTITTAMGYPTEMPEVVAALPRLRDKVASLISHRFSFDDVLHGFEIARTAQSAKVMIYFR